MSESNTKVREGVAGAGAPQGKKRDQVNRGRPSVSPTSALSDAPPPSLAAVPAPDPEVPERPIRRRYTAAYKLQILQQVEACREPGDVGRLLRREGLYSSLVSAWRSQRDEGTLEALSPKKRGRKAKEQNPLAKKVAQLEKEKRNLERRLKRAEGMLELQKKVSEILDIQFPKYEEESD